MDACILSAPSNERKVNAFTSLSLSVVLSEKLFSFLYLRSCVLFVDSAEVASVKAQSSYSLILPACINVDDLSLADRFSLIDERARTLFQLVSRSHLRWCLKERAFCLTSPPIKGRKNTVNPQSEPLKVQLASILSLTEGDDFDFW